MAAAAATEADGGVAAGVAATTDLSASLHARGRSMGSGGGWPTQYHRHDALATSVPSVAAPAAAVTSTATRHDGEAHARWRQRASWMVVVVVFVWGVWRLGRQTRQTRRAAAVAAHAVAGAGPPPHLVALLFLCAGGSWLVHLRRRGASDDGGGALVAGGRAVVSGAAASVVRAARAAAAAATSTWTAMTASTVTEVTHVAAGGVRWLQARLAATIESRVDLLTTTALARMQDAIIDRDMPAPLRQVIGDTIARAAPDVQRAVLHQVHALLASPTGGALLPPLPRPPAVPPPPRVVDTAMAYTGGGGGGGDVDAAPQLVSWVPCCHRAAVAAQGGWRAWRAAVLYELSPYDKSMWAVMRRPAYWVLTGVGLLPLPALSYTWWLMLFVMKDRTDEYQLADFIVGFETSKFFANGVWGLVQGAVRYYLCTTFPLVFPCATVAPGVSHADALFLILQVALVLWTFHLLRVLPTAHAPPPVLHVAAVATPAVPFTARGGGGGGGGRGTWRDAVMTSPVVAPLRRLIGGGGGGAVPATPAPLPPPQPPEGELRSWLYTAAAGYHHRGGAVQALFRYQLSVVAACAVLAAAAYAADAAIAARALPGVAPCAALGGVCFPLVGVSSGSSGGGGATVFAPTLVPGALYWIRTLYGLAALPYVLFKLPLVGRLYITRRASGYDAAGATRLTAAMPAPAPVPAPPAPAPAHVPPGTAGRGAGPLLVDSPLPGGESSSSDDDSAASQSGNDDGAGEGRGV